MRKAFVAALVAPALLIGACGGDDDTEEDSSVEQTEETTGETDGGGEGGESGGDISGDAISFDDIGRLVPAECEGAGNAASEDDGVAEDTVNIAALNIDFSKLAEIGFAASDRDPNAVMQVFIDRVNENGGVCGRTIDLQQVQYNILAGEGGQACVEVTEDRDNLLVVTAAYSEVLCVTDAGVPVISGNDLPQDSMEEGNGMLFTRFPSIEHQYEAVIRYAEEEGALDGSVGVWYGGVYPEQTQAVEDIVLPRLDELGVEYVSFRNDHVGPSDPEGNAILTSAATEFVANEVDTVLMFVQNTNHTGMQTELDAQGLNPRFISMPIAGNTANELFADRFGTREIADGQEWVTFTHGMTEIDSSEPIATACHETWTERTGEEVEENVYDYASIVSQCVQIDQLVAALSLAGGDLTRDRIVQALEALPAHEWPPLIGELDWTADDHYGPSVFSVHEYDGETNRVTTAEETFEIDS